MTTEQIAKLEVERNDALMRLGEIQAAVSEMFDLDHTATTADEICKVIHNAIHKYSSQRDSALGDRDQWREVAEILAGAGTAVREVLRNFHGWNYKGKEKWKMMEPAQGKLASALAAYERLKGDSK